MSFKRAYWCFTLNNYTDADVSAIEAFITSNCKFGIFGKEVGESGTRHLQGYLELAQRARLSDLKATVFEKAHLEPRRGSASQARNYCRKEDPSPFTYGEISSDPKPGSVSRDDIWRDLCATIKSGGIESLGGFIDRYPGVWGWNGSTLLRNYGLSLSPRDRPRINVRWIYGPPGVGKSRMAHEELPNAFIKDPRTKWWTGYLGEETCIIDDFGPGGIDINHLLRWFDRYKCTVETKGGVTPLLCDTFIVTSNFHPRQVFTDKVFTFNNNVSESSECEHPQLPALLRRINLIEMFDITNE